MLGPALLFCPGDRPDRFEKALRHGGHAILDLEDGVAATGKERARASVAEFLTARGPQRLLVRVNDVRGEIGARDLRALRASPPAAVLLPKVESPGEVHVAARILGEDVPLHVLIESAAGALRAAEICAAGPSVAAVAWGPHDLAADLGAPQANRPDGSYLDTCVVVRSLVLLAAAAARIMPIDCPTVELADLAVVGREAREAAALGFRAKMAIHPAQVAVIESAFRPPLQELERARRLLAAAQASEDEVFTFEGAMVDRPMFLRAEALVSANDCLRTEGAG